MTSNEKLRHCTNKLGAEPETGMLILGAPITIPGCVPPEVKSTFGFCAFFFSCSFLSLSRLISASVLF